jgi:CelD/BcsL family acetyltransferase involved in cellulose biosynthesis
MNLKTINNLAADYSLSRFKVESILRDCPPDGTVIYGKNKKTYGYSTDKFEVLLKEYNDKQKEESTKKQKSMEARKAILLENLRLRNERLELLNAQKKTQLVSVTEIQDYMTFTKKGVYAFLEDLFLNRMPAELVGKSAKEMRHCSETYVNELSDEFEKQTDEYGKRQVSVNA